MVHSPTQRANPGEPFKPAVVAALAALSTGEYEREQGLKEIEVFASPAAGDLIRLAFFGGGANVPT